MNLSLLPVCALLLTAFVGAQVESAPPAPVTTTVTTTVTATATATVVSSGTVVSNATFVSKTLYPLATCVVSGEPLDAETSKETEVDGRTFRTCCDKCAEKVVADPLPYAAKLDAAIIASQSASYPLTTCPVSGKPLGSMGEPVELLLDGVLVRLCCKGCTGQATKKAEPIAFAVRDAALRQQLAGHAMKTCVVSNEPLGEDTVNVMVGTALVRVCCAECVDKLGPDLPTVLGKRPAGAEGECSGCCNDAAAPGTPTAPVQAGGCCCSGKVAPAVPAPTATPAPIATPAPVKPVKQLP